MRPTPATRSGLLPVLLLCGIFTVTPGCGDDDVEFVTPEATDKPATLPPKRQLPTFKIVKTGPPRTVDGVPIPDWVPLYPNAVEPSGYFPMGDGAQAFRYRTPDSPDKVIESYRPLLTRAGYTVTYVRTPNQISNIGAISASAFDPERSIRVNLLTDDGGGTVLAYQVEAKLTR